MKRLVITSIVGLGLLAGPPGWVGAQQTQYPGSIQPGTTGQSGVHQQRIIDRSAISHDQLPAKVRQVIDSQTAGSSITSLQQAKWNGPAYQVTLNQSGRLVNLQIAPNGRILNNQPGHPVQVQIQNPQPISYERLPAPVRNAVDQQLAGGSVQSVSRGTWNGTVYQAVLASHPNRPLTVTQDGTILNSPFFSEAAGAAPEQQQTTPGAVQPGSQQQTAPGVITQPGAQAQPPQPMASAPGATQGSQQFKDLPWPVQQPMLERSGWAYIANVQKYTLPDGRTAYRGTYTKDNQRHEISVAEDGAFLGDRVLSQGQGATGTPSVMNFSQLPWPVQQGMMKATGVSQFSNVQQTTLPGGESGYTATYQKDNQQHQIQVGQDGAVLSDQVTGQTQ